LDAAFNLSITGGPPAIAPALDRVSAWLGAAGIGERSGFRLVPVIDEVITNILEHGQPSDGRVRLALLAEPMAVHMCCELRDSGPEFNPFQMPPSDLDAPMLRSSMTRIPALGRTRSFTWAQFTPGSRHRPAGTATRPRTANGMPVD